MKNSVMDWFKSGTPWIWLTAGAVSVSLVMVIGLLLLIAVRGLGQFWPSDVMQFEYQIGDSPISTILGEAVEEEDVKLRQLQDQGISLDTVQDTVTRLLIKRGNRDITGLDFHWVIENGIQQTHYPAEAIVIEREEWGNFYGFLRGLNQQQTRTQLADGALMSEVQAAIARKQVLAEKIANIEKDQIGAINYQMEKLRLKERGLQLDGIDSPAAYAKIASDRSELESEYASHQERLSELYQQINQDQITVVTAQGEERTIPIAKVRKIYQPNQMSTWEKAQFYVHKLGEFILDDPREANTEGGIFPAIFGTVLMVIIMSVLVTPFGVVAAVYLHEYAHKGPLTRTIRIAVNNLAGVPSVVYGVFGLGFFVYFLGGNIDQLFYKEALPTPTFGTPGLLWSSLTLAILTVPVVIVATEEGLSRIPRSIREGSLALGATQAETLWRTVLPMATPAMMTGLILAVARAAGEVAPLMMVGVVKLAPSLAIDANYPFLHLDRKFMHLGFHIYDVGFQSPNVEAARPLVYATALMLVVLIIALNFAAIMIRNRLREKYITAAQ